MIVAVVAFFFLLFLLLLSNHILLPTWPNRPIVRSFVSSCRSRSRFSASPSLKRALKACRKSLGKHALRRQREWNEPNRRRNRVIC